MSKFVGAFRELAQFSDLLRSQVEIILIDRLQAWLKVEFFKICEFGTKVVVHRPIERGPFYFMECGTSACQMISQILHFRSCQATY